MSTPHQGATAPTLSLIDVARLLSTPASAVFSTLLDQPGLPSPLLATGFPRPKKWLNGRPVWSRAEVEAFAADRVRLRAATSAARKGLLGRPFWYGGKAEVREEI